MNINDYSYEELLATLKRYYSNKSILHPLLYEINCLKIPLYSYYYNNLDENTFIKLFQQLNYENILYALNNLLLVDKNSLNNGKYYELVLKIILDNCSSDDQIYFFQLNKFNELINYLKYINIDYDFLYNYSIKWFSNILNDRKLDFILKMLKKINDRKFFLDKQMLPANINETILSKLLILYKKNLSAFNLKTISDTINDLIDNIQCLEVTEQLMIDLNALSDKINAELCIHKMSNNNYDTVIQMTNNWSSSITPTIQFPEMQEVIQYCEIQHTLMWEDAHYYSFS